MLRRPLVLACALLTAACSLELGGDEKSAPGLAGVTALAATAATDPAPVVTLTWAYDGAAPEGFAVARGETADSLQPLATTAEKSLADTAVAAGKTYFYQVQAFKSKELGAASEIVQILVAANEAGSNPNNPPPGGNPGPTYTYTGTGAALPAAVCGRDLTYSITAVTPAASAALQAITNATFTATLSYSLANTTSVALRISTSNHTLIAAGTAAPVPAGCGSVILTVGPVDLSGVDSSILLSVNTDWNSAVSYSIYGLPYFEVASLNAAPNSLVAPDADGNLNLTAGTVWEFYTHTYSSSFGLDLPFNGIVGTWYYPVLPTAGTGTYAFKVAPRFCNDAEARLQFTNTAVSAPRNLQTVLRWFVQLPAALVDAGASNGFTLAKGAGVTNRSVTVRNCTAATQWYALATNVDWLYPQAGTFSVAPNSTLSVTYAVDVTDFAGGTYDARLRLVSGAGTVHSRQVSAGIKGGSYSVTATTFAWYPQAATGSGMRLIAGGIDDDYAQFTLPFPVYYYGVRYTQLTATSNGLLSFGASTADGCCGGTLPTTTFPSTLFVNWDDMEINVSGQINWAVTGTAPSRKIIVSYYKVGWCCSGTNPSTYQVVLSEDSSDIVLQYGVMDATGDAGANLGASSVYTLADAYNDATGARPSNTAYRLVYQP